MKELKNPEHEKSAQDIAKAIFDENVPKYKYLISPINDPINGMNVSEIRQFRERVHYLCDEMKKVKLCR